MPRTAVGRRAADLPWLCPNTTGLVALAERPADLPALAADDIALLTFLARFASDAAGTFPLQQLLNPSLADTAAAFLGHAEAGWLDPLSAVVIDLDAVARTAGELAGPDAAAARLAPLGWYAVAAVDKSAATACLRDPAYAADPLACQRKHWGYDCHAIARRLALRWKLPDWLTWPSAAVARAVAEAQRETRDLGLTPKAGVGSGLVGRVESSRPDGSAVDRGRDPHRRQVSKTRPDLQAPSQVPSHHNPYRVPLLPSLLRTAAEARRRNGAALVLRLEDEIDALHARLGDDGVDIHAAKLAALAEFAAGAGHEINNPLAVISGHAQRLLRSEADDDRADSLRAVVRQTQRIAGILREVMQFARPPQPSPGRVDVAELLEAVADELEPFAAERGVRLETADADGTIAADAGQLRQALAAVVRNGIEAAGADGWVRIRAEECGRIVVEDGGPGLSAEVVAHAFDPFYCGRPAGRGRGLGLPTAWRLAQQNGGDLRHEPGDGPTRFVFTFPPAGEAAFPTREAA